MRLLGTILAIAGSVAVLLGVFLPSTAYAVIGLVAVIAGLLLRGDLR